jgi:cytochrome c oxidase assembly protein subunit 15
MPRGSYNNDMATAHASPARTALPSPALRRFAWLVTAYTVLVIVWGGAVTATGSGNGCGEHWPLCDGRVVVHHPALTTMIEYAHRLSSGLFLILVAALMVWTLMRTQRKHLARVLSVVGLVLTVNEALLGAGLVMFGYTDNKESLARTLYFALHFTNTFLLLAAVAGTAHFLSRREGYLRHRLQVRALGFALPGLIAILAVGVTGSLAALGDSIYPATSLGAALKADFAGHGSLLIRLRWLHPAIALLAGVFLLWLVAGAVQKPALRMLGVGLMALLGVQYCLGVADVLLLAPTWVQLLHLLGADVLWIVTLLISMRLCLVDDGAVSLRG